MINLDINVGDEILGGRFKNKRIIVKTIGTDQHNQPTINGRPILKFRIEKLMNKNEIKEESILRQLIREEVTNIIKHARKELDLAGYNVNNPKFDYGDAIGQSALEMIEAFSKAHHSGFSAEAALAVFDKLVRFKNLTELTSNPEEWNDVSEMSGKQPMWQNKRNSAVFSEDGGKTWYNIDDEKTINEARKQVILRLLIREELQNEIRR